MKKLPYVSPSSYYLWKNDRVEFYRRYISEVPCSETPVNEAMQLGSAFDYQVRADMADKAGNTALRDLSLAKLHALPEHYGPLSRSMSDWYFKRVDWGDARDWNLDLNLKATIDGVVIHGYPDLVVNGNPIIVHDWKVTQQSKIKEGYDRLITDTENFLNDSCPFMPDPWRDQLAFYWWLICGEVKPIKKASLHRLHITPKTRKMRLAVYACGYDTTDIFRDVKKLWAAVENEHIFDAMSKEASDDMCRQIDSSHVP